ncbi:hypothetical protein BH10BAC5_BH10BAC5_08780 [soil metagenome]
MNYIKHIAPRVFAIILFLSASLPLYAQLQDKSLNNYNNSRESFYADPLVFYFSDSLNARLDVYIEIPYDNLQFKNTSAGSHFAQITYTFKLTNEYDKVLMNDTYSEDIDVSKSIKNYREDSKIIVKTFPVSPGKYNLGIVVRDKNASLDASKNFPLNISMSGSDVYASSIMLVSNYDKNDAGKKSITPSIDNNIGNLKEFFTFYELYNKKPEAVNESITYSFYDQKNTEILKQTNSYLLQPGSNKIIERFPADNFVIGDYRLDVKNSAGIIVSTKRLYNRWLGFPFNIKDLDLAISQMIYIARSEELNKIKASKTEQEKEKRFIDFWKSKDPSPNTPKNELMIEYYTRIKLANEKYGSYKEGWRSDMGMVYIIFGTPSSIDRHPFDSNAKPYEVWEYYDLNRQFVFVDDSGFGDFRLLTPIYETFRSR